MVAATRFRPARYGLFTFNADGKFMGLYSVQTTTLYSHRTGIFGQSRPTNKKPSFFSRLVSSVSSLSFDPRNHRFIAQSCVAVAI